MHDKKRVGVAALAAAGLAITVASPANAAGSYSILKSSGTFVAAGPTNLFPQQTDDSVRKITFPFRVNVYGFLRSAVWVSTNGNLQFTDTPSAAYSNGCLPTSSLSGGVIAVYWDDILIRDNTASGDGVFTRTYGKAPARKFVISWRGVELSDASKPVRAEIIFYEGKTFFDTVYASGTAHSATVGIQMKDGTNVSQWNCNGDRNGLFNANDQLRWNFS